VQETNALPGGDAIALPAGTYAITIPGANEDAAATGDLDITDDLTLTGAGRNVTVIDANQLDRVFDTQPGQSQATAVTGSGLTIQGGRPIPVGPGPSGGVPGGGVLNRNGVTLSLEDVVVAYSTAGDDGGGIHNMGPSGNLSIADSVITNNEGSLAAESAGGGGGISNSGQATIKRSLVDGNRSGTLGGGISSTGSLLVEDSVIRDNEASAFSGGGIAVGGEFFIADSLIRGNRARQDGGGLANSGSATITGTKFEGNTALLRHGGGLRNLGSASITGGSFDSNSAAGDGGGIRNGTTEFARAATISLVDVSLSQNTSGGVGGGVANGGMGSASTEATFLRTTLQSNTAVYGGGIANFGNDVLPGIWGTVGITNSTISGNQATSAGGGISNGGGFSVTNATIAFNTAPADQAIENGPFSGIQMINTIVHSVGPANDCSPSAISSLGHNLSSDGTCNLNAAGDLPNTDPLLEPLDDNGGFTQTHALASGSPAIDAADGAACPSTDQRGAPRPFEDDSDGAAACDIGAYEAGSTPPATPTPTPGLTNTPEPPPPMATPTSTPGSLPRTGERPEPGGRSTASPAVWGALCAAAGALTIPILAHRRAPRRRGGKP
jgi:hypothetical protein